MNLKYQPTRLVAAAIISVFATGNSFVWDCAPVLADQNDPKLDSLFSQLLTTDDQQSGNKITDEIWDVWRQSGSVEIDALMRDGVATMQSGRLRESVAIFDQIIRLAPNFAEGWNKRATAYFFLREFEKSAADVRKTLVLEPRHFGAISGLGLIFLEIEYYESALQAFEDALEINPHLVGPKQQIRRLKTLLRNEPA